MQGRDSWADLWAGFQPDSEVVTREQGKCVDRQWVGKATPGIFCAFRLQTRRARSDAPYHHGYTTRLFDSMAHLGLRVQNGGSGRPANRNGHAPRSSRALVVRKTRLSVPSGESPDGTGQWPGPPKAINIPRWSGLRRSSISRHLAGFLQQQSGEKPVVPVSRARPAMLQPSA